jgi:hypothetical protein
MKSKVLLVISTLSLALTMMAQNATQATPSTSSDTKTCACCNHDKSDAKVGEACCIDCCKDSKCAMISKEGTDGKKCPMMAKDGKMAESKVCCSDDKCPMHAKGDKFACCCGNMGEHQHA